MDINIKHTPENQINNSTKTPHPEIPFDVIRCSWPRPVEQRDGRWISQPEWDAPQMPLLPQPRWELIHSELCWTIDWREMFKSGLKLWNHNLSGEMRGFHIIFHLRIRDSGKLVFWDDDGCMIRRNGQLVHCDPSAHMLKRSEIEVSAGDQLEIAQWQHIGGWLWGARLDNPQNTPSVTVDLLLPYLDLVQKSLRHPNGPALKMYTNGATPVRAIVSLYSMILNGYSPSRVLLFGESDWSQHTRELFAAALPFAQTIPTEEVIRQIQSAGGPRLAEMARRYWFVMKACISLLYPPEEFCLMDDDVFILDRVDDALAAFRQNDLVFAPDTDHGRTYLTCWGWMHGKSGLLGTGTLNAGLYWIRNFNNPRSVAAYMLRVRPNTTAAFVWEQGFIANLYAHKNTCQLPTQRYFYPLFDGLPGGILGYDYALNPCRFASIHFGGLVEKPSDTTMPYLAAQILDRYRKCKFEYEAATTV